MIHATFKQPIQNTKVTIKQQCHTIEDSSHSWPYTGSYSLDTLVHLHKHDSKAYTVGNLIL